MARERGAQVQNILGVHQRSTRFRGGMEGSWGRKGLSEPFYGAEGRKVRRGATQAGGSGGSGHGEQAGRGENAKQLGNAMSSSPR